MAPLKHCLGRLVTLGGRIFRGGRPGARRSPIEEDAIAEWQRERREPFGERWPAVQRILAVLGDAYGIFVTDVNPGNIMFDDA